MTWNVFAATIEWVRQLTEMSDEALFTAVATEADPNRKMMVLTEIRFRGRWAEYQRWRTGQQNPDAPGENGVAALD